MGLGTTTTQDRVVAMICANSASLLRIAQKHSLCADDAQDAYQRTLEIYLERLEHVEAATAGAWLRTVCKHEAMRIREQRQRMLSGVDFAWDRELAADAADADERVASLERVARAAEALQGCKADEATAMLLKADGSSYAEIGELTGWSATKVNRCLAEGRARFLRRFGAIDSGEACEGWAPTLSAIVDGQASPEDFARLRPHLRHCAGCRGTLKALYETEPVLGALVPAGLLAGAGAEPVSGVVARAYEALAAGLGERLARMHAVVEAVTSTKAAAVVASTAAVAAGGAAAADRGADRPDPRAGSRDAVAARVEPAPARKRVAAPRAADPRTGPRTPAFAPPGPAATGGATDGRVPVVRGPGAPATGRGATRTGSPSKPPGTPAEAPAPAPADLAFEASAPAAARTGTPRQDPEVGRPSDTGGEFGFEG